MTRAHPAASRAARAIGLLLASGFLATAPLIGLATGAAAHASQTGAEPAASSVLPAAPDRVVITFDTAVLDVGAALVVRDSARADVTSGPPRVRSNTISVPLRPDLGAGTYTVAYRVVSADGHPVSTSYTFSVSGPASATPASPAAQTSAEPTTPAPSAEPPASSGTSSTVNLGVVAAAVAVAAAGAAAVVVVIRRR